MPNLNVSHSSISTVSGIEEQGQQDDKFGKQMENTYQLGENMTKTDCTTFSLTNKLCIDKVLIQYWFWVFLHVSSVLQDMC